MKLCVKKCDVKKCSIFFAFDNPYTGVYVSKGSDGKILPFKTGRCLGHQRAHGHPCLFEQVRPMAVFSAALVRHFVLPLRIGKPHCLESLISSHPTHERNYPTPPHPPPT